VRGFASESRPPHLNPSPRSTGARGFRDSLSAPRKADVDHLEYLLSYGLAGDFGRFRANKPLACGRGDRAVVRTHRGLEMGRVLREATPRHANFLPNTTVGALLRLASPEDNGTAERLRERGQRLFEHGRRLANELQLPLEVIDAEVLLDGEHGVLHLLRFADCDVRPFVSSLSTEHALHILLTDLGRPGASIGEQEEEHAGCGREGCGEGAGGCGSCGTGGCGSCGTTEPVVEKEYFAGLRDKMEQRRTTLL
jgi:PSP1 C-terminal conserved region